MPIFNPEFLVVLEKKIDAFECIPSFIQKYSITPTSIASPANIQNLDKEVSANPQLANEAITLVEAVAHLSLFYAESGYSYVDAMTEQYVRLRTLHVSSTFDANSLVMHEDVMSEYNVLSQTDGERFIRSNPVMLGVYIYVTLFWLLR